MESSNLVRHDAHPHPTLESVVWLLHLRWVAVAGQLAVIVGVQWLLRIELPMMSLLALVGFTAATNAVYSFWLDIVRRRQAKSDSNTPTYHLVACLMLVDLLTLTGMLWLSGSLQNPFALFYFVNIAVAGVILTPVWAWSLWIGAVFCVVMLMLVGEPLPALANQGWATTSRWSIGRIGLLISFATCGGVITYFITMLTGELKQRELELKAAEDERLRARQLEGLATLAAGAGHELATPLSTIAVVVKELGRAVEKHSLPPSVGQDIALIRSELDHCRQILDRLASAAGDAAGERLKEASVEEFFHEVILGVREPGRVRVQVADAAKATVAVLPMQAVAQAVRNLVQNAIDASQPGADVQLCGELNGADKWRILVVDRGDGMTPEVLQRIGQPFFTTKEPGRGMGLGLYLTQNVLNRLGGKLTFSSKPGHGTTAEVLLPCKRSVRAV